MAWFGLRPLTSLFMAPEMDGEAEMLRSASTAHERAHRYQRLHRREELPETVKVSNWLLAGHSTAHAADPDNPDERWIIDRTVDLAEKAGIKHVPGIFIIHSHVPNAASIDSKHMVVTRGLLETMNRDEVTAVIGHELSHHRHGSRDLFGIFGSYMAAAGAGLAVTLTIARTAELRAKPSSEAILTFSGLFAYFTGSAASSAYRRSIEYEADKEAADVTSPEQMQSALQTLDERVKELKEEAKKGQKTTAYGLLRKAVKLFLNPFPTHPSTKKRIARLEAMKERSITLDEPVANAQAAHPSYQIHEVASETLLEAAELQQAR